MVGFTKRSLNDRFYLQAAFAGGLDGWCWRGRGAGWAVHSAHSGINTSVAGGASCCLALPGDWGGG